MKELTKIAIKLEDYLMADTPLNEGALLLKLSEINKYLVITSRALAEAKLYQEETIATLFTDYHLEMIDMPASIAKEFLKGLNRKANHLVNWLERLNRTLVHTGENSRAQLSFIQQQLKQ